MDPRALAPLFRKLGHLAALTADDRRFIETRAWRIEHVSSHANLVREGDEPRSVRVVLEGWACRFKQLEDGRRQIIALLLPGDMCDPCVFLLDEMSHALATLTPAVVAHLPQADMRELLDARPGLAKAFWLELLISTEVQREWTVSLGRRTAVERMAHLFCEMLMRLSAVGLADRSGCEMPITQADLGDALGLSAVHVNRTLQQLRALRLLELRGKRLVVADEDALRTLALFDPSYLHLQRSIS